MVIRQINLLSILMWLATFEFSSVFFGVGTLYACLFYIFLKKFSSDFALV